MSQTEIHSVVNPQFIEVKAEEPNPEDNMQYTYRPEVLHSVMCQVSDPQKWSYCLVTPENQEKELLADVVDVDNKKIWSIYKSDEKSDFVYLEAVTLYGGWVSPSVYVHQISTGRTHELMGNLYPVTEPSLATQVKIIVDKIL
jgi:hypothetical protein